MRAGDIMRTAVASVAPADRLSRVAEFMTIYEVRELPVVENGVLVGIVTRSDLEPYVGQLEWTPVRLAMSSPPRTVGPDEPVYAVAKVLAEESFNGVPVVVDRALAGMISRHDLVRVLAGARTDVS
jgi:CBS domain-containing protein